MSDWSGGYGGARPANAKIPAKVHRNVSLIRTSDRLFAEELLAHPKLSQLIVGRLTDTVLLVQSGAAGDVVDLLRKIGHTPQVAARARQAT